MYLLVLPVHFFDWSNYVRKLRPFLVVHLLHICHSNRQECMLVWLVLRNPLTHKPVFDLGYNFLCPKEMGVVVGAQMRHNERGSLGEVFQPSLHSLQLSLDGISQL